MFKYKDKTNRSSKKEVKININSNKMLNEDLGQVKSPVTNEITLDKN